MRILPVVQSSYNQNQTNFKGIFHFSVPLDGLTLVKLREIEDGLADCKLTSLIRDLEGDTKACLKISCSRDEDLNIVSVLRSLVKEVRESLGPLTVYRADSIHKLKMDELRNITINKPECEIF